MPEACNSVVTKQLLNHHALDNQFAEVVRASQLKMIQ